MDKQSESLDARQAKLEKDIQGKKEKIESLRVQMKETEAKLKELRKKCLMRRGSWRSNVGPTGISRLKRTSPHL